MRSIILIYILIVIADLSFTAPSSEKGGSATDSTIQFKSLKLSDVENAGANHANEADRKARLFGFGFGGLGYGYRPWGYRPWGYRPWGYGYGYRPWGGYYRPYGGYYRPYSGFYWG